MVTGDRDRVVFRNVLRRVFKRVDHELHRGLDRVNPFFLCDVFLENVVLQGARDLVEVSFSVFLRRPDTSQGRSEPERLLSVKRLHCQRNAVEENFEICKARDSDTAFADLAFTQRRIGVKAINAGRSYATERPVWPCSKILEACIRVLGGEKRRTAASSRACRDNLWDECRVCKGTRRGSRRRPVAVRFGVETLDRLKAHALERRFAFSRLLEHFAQRFRFPTLFQPRLLLQLL